MPWDLYGNSYPTELEAMNAEMAQCAAIDAGITQRKLREADERAESDRWYLEQWQREVERRLSVLESFLPISICEGEGR